jgi:hypothetical protein
MPRVLRGRECVIIEYNWGREDAAWVKSGLAAVEQGCCQQVCLQCSKTAVRFFFQLHILHTILIWISMGSG